MNDSNEVKDVFQKILERLSIGTPREQAIMKYRLGIPLDREFTEFERNLPLEEVNKYIPIEAHSVDETAAQFGMTRERVRQIEQKFMRRHSGCRRKKNLKDYLE